jgi:alpha-glucosidase
MPLSHRPVPCSARRAARVASISAALAALAIPTSGRALHAQAGGYSLLGDAGGYERVPGGALISAPQGRLLVETIAGVGARVRVRFGDASRPFAEIHSLATGDTPPRLGSATVREAGDTIVVSGEGVEVRVSRHPLRVVVRDAAGHELLHESLGAASYGGRVAHYVRDPSGTRYLGLGEQPSPMIRNGTVFPFWNTDRYGYEPGVTPIYSTLPFYIGLASGVAHGVLYDNPFRGEMDFANRLPGSIGYTAEGAPDGGELRWYVVPGPGLDSTVARYTRLTGRTPLPPRWALGYQQSRYSYFPDTMVANLAADFRRRDIPADVLYLDIDYMDGYRVFTWSPKSFPHPRQLLDSLGANGFKVVTIVDPGVKVDPGYPIYREVMARRAYVALPDGTPALGKVWPDTSVFPDFSRAAVRAWWGGQQSALLDAGVRGIWNDMNEPASFLGGTLSELAQFDGDGHPGPHLEYHNQYGTLMARSSYEGQRALRPARRPFVITRAAYTGVQRYSSVWTGDNNSTFTHLRLSLSMVLSLGLTGVPFAGSDIGGFTGAPSAELYARWLQSAALIPFFRTHAATGTPRREPWSFGPDHERANRATIRLRYALLPAVYTAFHQHTLTGSPVVRPVFWQSPSDTAALGVQDEYFLGDHLLAAPVADSGADQRSVYLPAGRWYRLGSDSAYEGARRVTVSAPRAAVDGGDTTGLRGLPLFVRAGAVVPMQPVLPYDGARRVDTLTLHVYPGAASSQLYEDAGDGYENERGQYRLTTLVTAVRGEGGGSIALSRTGSYGGAGTFAVVLHATSRPRGVTADGRAVAIDYDASGRVTRFSVPSVTSRIEMSY